jgi:general secretion pathway protein D
MRIRGGWLACLLAWILSGSVSQAKEPKQNKDLEVTVGASFVSLDQSVIQRLNQEKLLKQESNGIGFLSLDNAQMKRFMEIIQSDIHTNVMQAPRLTMFNGQRSEFESTDKQHFATCLEIVHRDGKIEYRPKSETIPLGWRIALRSVVSPDRRRVRVHLEASANNLACSKVPRLRITTTDDNGKGETETHYIEQPQITKLSVNRKVVIPDGNTAVLTTGVKQMRVQRTDVKVPILGDLPVLGRLFSSIGYSCQTLHLLVLLTPHIQVHLEKEEKPPVKKLGYHRELQDGAIAASHAFR